MAKADTPTRMRESNSVELPWLDPVMQRVAQAQQQDRVASAYMLSGPLGSGVEWLAERIVALLMCEHPQNTRACGVCAGCHLVQADTHPDVEWVRPHQDGHPIKVDQIRRLIERLEQTAQYQRYRCVVLEPAEALNVPASNSLLKVLEEPGERVVFLLVSHYPNRLLPTVRSRCQSLQIAMPTDQEAQDWLRTQDSGHSTAERIERAWQWSVRSPRSALDLLQSDELDQLESVANQWQAMAQTGDCADWVKLADTHGVDWALERVHRLVWLQLESLSTNDEKAAQWHWLHDQLVDLKRLRVSGVNLNVALMWEKLAVDWFRLNQKSLALTVSFSD